MTCRCGMPLEPDQAFNETMQTYGLPQRRAGCRNGHSAMLACPAPLATPTSSSGRQKRRDAQ